MDAPFFLLAPTTPAAAALYPAGRQTLAKANPRLDSGVDLVAPAAVECPPGAVTAVRLGVRVACFRATGGVTRPAAYWLLTRSSISKTPLSLANSAGLMDQGYRGEVIAKVRNLGAAPYTLAAGTALFQLAAADLAPPEWEVLPPGDARERKYFGEGATLRGAGGFGSTGAAGSAAPAP